MKKYGYPIGYPYFLVREAGLEGFSSTPFFRTLPWQNGELSMPSPTSCRPAIQKLILQALRVAIRVN